MSKYIQKMQKDQSSYFDNNKIQVEQYTKQQQGELPNEKSRQKCLYNAKCHEEKKKVQF